MILLYVNIQMSKHHLLKIILGIELSWSCCGKAVEHKSVFTPIPKKGNAKECSNYSTITLISHASKEMLKILQVRLQQYMNWKFPDIQAGFRKVKGTRQRSNCQHPLDHRKGKENSRKTSTSTSLNTLKPLTVWVTTNCGKFLKRWE